MLTPGDYAISNFHRTRDGTDSGGKNAKKCAIVAVARKLAVLLHHLWITGETYEPLREFRKEKVVPSR